jgi:hypothetical protein
MMAAAVALALTSGGLLAGCSAKKSNATPTAVPETATAVAATAISDAVSQEMKAITAKLSTVTFKGTYALTTSGSAGLLSDGHLVLYKEGDKRIRYDVTGKQDGQLVFIEAGDATLVLDRLEHREGRAGIRLRSGAKWCTRPTCITEADLPVDGSSSDIGESRAEPRGVRRYGQRRSAGAS